MEPLRGLELLLSVCRHGLPPVPPNALRLCLDVAADDDAPLSLIVDTLDSDWHHSAAFLILASSFTRSRRCELTSTHQAVSLIGRTRTQELLWILALSEAWLHYADLHPRLRDRLWRHSLLTAELADRFSADFALPDVRLAAAAGMAHDVGHLLLHDQPPKLRLVGAEDELPVVADEAPSDERDHCRLGATLLEFWHAPEELHVTALRHHDGDDARDCSPLVHLVRLADLAAEFADSRRPPRLLALSESRSWQRLVEEFEHLRAMDIDALVLERLATALQVTERLARLVSPS